MGIDVFLGLPSMNELLIEQLSNQYQQYSSGDIDYLSLNSRVGGGAKEINTAVPFRAEKEARHC